MQESSRQPRPRRQPDHELAERLDRLTEAEAERVLERAIRIHADRSQAHTFTVEQVEQVAAELGLPAAVVRRALEEELAAPEPGGPMPLLGPKRLVARTAVDDAGAEVSDRVSAWLESEEGLRPSGPVTDGMRWEPDSHWATGARMALGSEGTKALRGMRQTTHRLVPMAPDRQLVELEVDTSAIRTGAAWTGASIGAAGLAGGVATAFALAGGNDLIQFLSVAAPVVAAGLGATVAVGRVWAASVRRGMDRALHGIAHPELYPRAARRAAKRRASGRGRIERLVDEVSDALDRLLD